MTHAHGSTTGTSVAHHSTAHHSTPGASPAAPAAPHAGGAPDGAAPQSAEQFWEGFYRERDKVWSGRPNAALVREAASLPAAAALDLGCGEGADAIWLAEQGWQVTAVDVSDTALGRGAGHAAAAGVADRIDWQAHNLDVSFPDGSFDLVSAQFLHSPVEIEGGRNAILRRAAGAVAPGGVLVIVGHAGWPTWMTEPAVELRFPANADVLDALGLEPGRWLVEVDGRLTSESTGPEGQSGTRDDNVLRLRRSV